MLVQLMEVGDIPKDTGGAEKRSSARKRVHWRMLILLNAGEKKPGYVVDVSEGGMQLQSIHSFPTGSVLDVAVFVPDARKAGSYLPTRFQCKVAYQVLKGSEVVLGVAFVGAEDEALQRLRAAMNMS
ncbi:MAG: PilZ domain-containing protein [Uliginosibacterium sp.]|nr:PilZ domain-containing protein [Uliginosibacterium sp.]